MMSLKQGTDSFGENLSIGATCGSGPVAHAEVIGTLAQAGGIVRSGCGKVASGAVDMDDDSLFIQDGEVPGEGIHRGTGEPFGGFQCVFRPLPVCDVCRGAEHHDGLPICRAVEDLPLFRTQTKCPSLWRIRASQS